MTSPRRTPGGIGWTPWRVLWGLGFVSLAADMVYEGARSVYGPLLGALGASAVTVGLVSGAGEAAALVLRLVFGPLADRTRGYWPLPVAGYALTAVCVPLLALAPRVGAAGLAFAVILILLERTGKAVRSPAKSALLADAATSVSRGRGFGVHKALDQPPCARMPSPGRAGGTRSGRPSCRPLRYRGRCPAIRASRSGPG